MSKKVNIIKAVLDMPVKEGMILPEEKERAEILFIDCGYAEVPDDDGRPYDTVWHWCNWPSWTGAKPADLCSDIRGCNSDIIVWWDGSPYWAADSIGWKSFSDLDSAKLFMVNRRDCLWPAADAPVNSLHKFTVSESTDNPDKVVWINKSIETESSTIGCDKGVLDHYKI